MHLEAYSFQDSALLELALTHASVSGASNNERLEFLGDAVLDLVVADELYRHHRALDEGALTELKASVVSRRSLAEGARRLELETVARLGGGMRGRALSTSVLANLYEAVVGAVYLDGGYLAASKFCMGTLRPQLGRVRERRRAANPKQDLQEFCQGEWNTTPAYDLLRERGLAHSRAFLVQAVVGERAFPSAWGRTRKEAERWAAHEAMLVLVEEGEFEWGQETRRGTR